MQFLSKDIETPIVSRIGGPPSTCLVVRRILKPLSFLVLVSLKVLESTLHCCPQNIKTPIVSRIRDPQVLEFEMSCCPKNIETPIVLHVGEPQGTEIQITWLSTIYQNPYRFW